ncbi:MAG TPA: ABC transporter ATP-binding protein [Spirochaetia bacterium]|nr:MAG: ABC transporter [Spirochaetes bacterium GWB1_36_13]HCL56903.1 ABC transporter ATP-binding protein [Spirochaetia bacterium]
MKPILQIKNISKTYDHFQAVKNLSFDVPEAVCFGLLGPNGAGKTTLMKMIYGKCKRDCLPETSVQVLGYDPAFHSFEIKALSGIVPQEDNLDTELNVLQNLMIYSKFYNIPKKEALQRINELLHFMELEDRKKSKIRSLSGGMKRRLTIARSLLNRPKILILDEPTTGLDPQVRHLIWNKLRELKRQGVTILLTTHYMEEAYQICDEILIMDKGEKIVQGNPEELLKNNIEKFVLEIFDKNIQLPSEANDFRLDTTQKDMLYVYSSSFETLQKLETSLKGQKHYLRQSNLEDLFLKATGRTLNESQ